MMHRWARLKILYILLVCVFTYGAIAQCPSFSNFSVTGNSGFMCEGEMLTVSLSGQNIVPGSSVEFYLGTGNFNPYNAEGDFIGSVLVMVEECNNIPEVLYIMVNPDNTLVGSSNDKCDEFMVLWTGSGGFSTTDIVVSNLSNGSFQWDNFVAGDASGFSCGVSLPPGPVPPNAILIITGALTNNVFINSDVLCESGLPVYIISNNNTDCTLGWFDNSSPCASCPVQIDINGVGCAYSFNLNYMPPGSSTNGWGWSNMGSGVFSNVVPTVDLPTFQSPVITIPNFVWTVPSSFCETFGEGDWLITGILNPPPSVACPDIFTPYFDANVSCPEMTLTGGGDVCEGNCPDAPNSIFFTIAGNDVPFLADLQVTSSSFPPFNINDIEIFNGQEFFICLGGIFPSFDPVTNTLTVPSFAVGLTATVTVISLESESGCPVTMGTNSITLNFIEAPTADAGSDETICSDEDVALNGSIGGSATDAMWSTSGDGIFADPSNASTFYTPGQIDSINGSVTLTLVGTDPNGACIPAESSILITIEPSYNVDLGPSQTICNTDIVNVMAIVTGPAEPGFWESSGDGTFDDPNSESTFYTPGFADLSNGSVTLYYTIDNQGVCTVPNEPLEITFVNAPVVTVPQDLEVCDDETLSVDINVSGNFTNITWFANGDGNLVILNNMEIEYTPGPQDIINGFTIISVTVVSGFSQCGQTTYNLSVIISSCDCPAFETSPPPSICSEGAGLVLATILQSGGPGEWTITSTPPGSNPATITGDIFLTANSDPGVYTLTYTLDFPEPGCPATSSENITVLSPIIPEAGSNIANCGPANVFINGTVIPFGPANTMWQTLGDGTFVNPFTLATSYIPGTLDSAATEIVLLLHVIDPVCGNHTDSVKILFPEPPFTTFSEDTIRICNQEDKGSVISFLSQITGGDSLGVWTNSSGVPVNFSNLDSVNFNGIAAGFYNFNYRTNSAMFPCQEVDYTIVVEVDDCLCPLIQLQNVPAICNDEVSVNLAAFVVAGASGTWQLISSPNGSSPATLAGSLLQTAGADGGFYRLRFTLDSAPLVACPDSAEIDIFIQELPLVDVPGDKIVCGLTGIQLNATLNGSTSGLHWNSSGTGDFNDSFLLNPFYTPSIDDFNSSPLTIYATTIDSFGFCVYGIDSFSLSFVAPPTTMWSSLSTSVCNHPDSGSVLNLTSFIIGGENTGIWTDLDGASVNLSDPAMVDFDGIMSGVYTFSYSTQTAVSPCVDSTYLFTIVVQDCSCPPFAIHDMDLIFCEGQVADLDSLLIIDVAPGSWSLSNGPPGMWPTISGNLLTMDSGTAGNYTLIYILSDSIPGCLASDGVLLTVEEPSTISLVSAICDPDKLTYSVIVTSSASDLISDFGLVADLGSGQFMINNVPVNQDILIETVSTPQVCLSTLFVDAPDCACTLFTEDLSDTIFLCPGDTFVLIPFITGAQGLAFATWISDVTLMQPTLPLFEAKTWIWVVIDSAGCERRDTFDVAIRELITADVQTISPTCNGISDGSIIILDIDGGQGPYNVQLDNMGSFISDIWPYTIPNIDVGIHNLSITNSDGCQTVINIPIVENSTGYLSLGPNVSIHLGDSLLIEPSLSDINVQNIVWDPLNLNSNLDPFWYTPDQTTLILLIVTDSMGCMYEVELLITVLIDQDFFVPNIFSPNNDQINDILEVSTSSNNNSIKSLEIFDRWGNMIYSQSGASPFRWDGFSKGKLASPGVYAVKVVYKDDEGKDIIYISDLTLIR